MRNHSMALILALAAGPALAEEAGRGVARVSLVNGDITMQRGDSGDWIAAAVNAPLVAGDKVHAARASRAEVQLDWANFVRLAENTEVRMADLENRRYQIQVSRGLATYRILRGAEADAEINTPVVAVRPLRRGTYRIQVLANGETEITVRDGKAEVFSSQGAETLEAGRTMIVRAAATDRAVEAQVVRAAGRDDWDDWNERRDKQIERSRSHQYVHHSVYGVDDLDDHGYWRHVDGHGWSWFPRVVVGWSPYSSGRWVWLDWYGWSWVGYEPWGWAPYHYGRWFHNSHYGWGWWPGGRHHHYWSPALVGFFGWGGHRGFGGGIGFGYGNVGWVPLAPGEAYYPWYGNRYYGRGYRNVHIDNSVNITNITNINNVYRNARVNGGVLSVDANDFARGNASRLQRVNVADVRNAGQIRGMLPVVPERESLRVTDREARAGAIPRADGGDSRFFTRRQPTTVERVPFAERQQQISRSVRGEGGTEGRRVEGGAAGGGVGTDRGERRAGEERTPATVRGGAVQEPGERAAERNADRGSGLRRLGEGRQPATEAGTRATPDAGVRTEPSERSVERSTGWRRLGEARRPAAEAGTRTAPETGIKTEPSERSTGLRRLGEERRPATEAGTRATPDAGVRTEPSERSTGWRRLGEERRPAAEAGTRTAPETGVRSGEERREATERTVTPAPAPAERGVERNVDRGADRGASWRRFGQVERESTPSAPRRESFEERRSVRDSGEPARLERDRTGGTAPQREVPRIERRSEPVIERREASPDRGDRGGRSFGDVSRRSEPRGESRNEPRGDAGRQRLEINRPLMMERAPRQDGGGRAAPTAPPSGSGDGGRVGRSSGGGGERVRR